MYCQLVTYRVAQKSVYRKKIEYLPYSSSKQVDFFINDRGMFNVYFHKEMLREALKYSEKKRSMTEPLKKVLQKSESFQMRPKSQKNDKKFGRTL